MNNVEPVKKEQIDSFVVENQPWIFVEDSLQARFEFADFNDAMEVVSKVAEKAEELQHHPFWSNEYNKLAFVLSTHDAGDVVTEKDLILARAISEIVTGK